MTTYGASWTHTKEVHTSFGTTESRGVQKPAHFLTRLPSGPDHSSVEQFQAWGAWPDHIGGGAAVLRGAVTSPQPQRARSILGKGYGIRIQCTQLLPNPPSPNMFPKASHYFVSLSTAYATNLLALVCYTDESGKCVMLLASSASGSTTAM